MPIPLGILAVAGAGGAAGDYELIATAFGTGSSGTITFSSIDQSYKHLQLRIVGKSTGAGTDTRLTFNGVSTSTHSAHFLQGNGAIVSAGASLNQPFIRLYSTLAQSTTTNAFAGSIIDILDYTSTTKNKTIRNLSGHTGSVDMVNLSGGQAPSSAAITSLSLVVNTAGNFYTSTSRFSLYGIKG
jgi:hypothetical protein